MPLVIICAVFLLVPDRATDAVPGGLSWVTQHRGGRTPSEEGDRIVSGRRGHSGRPRDPGSVQRGIGPISS